MTRSANNGDVKLAATARKSRSESSGGFKVGISYSDVLRE